MFGCKEKILRRCLQIHFDEFRLDIGESAMTVKRYVNTMQRANHTITSAYRIAPEELILALFGLLPFKLVRKRTRIQAG